MKFKVHPIFDGSPASDWLDLNDAREPLPEKVKPFAALIQVYRKEMERLSEKVLERIKRHLGERELRERPHIERNQVLFAPLGDRGFQVYFEFYFLERSAQASPDSDFWWGIIFCPYAFDERYADLAHWNVVHFGWCVS